MSAPRTRLCALASATLLLVSSAGCSFNFYLAGHEGAGGSLRTATPTTADARMLAEAAHEQISRGDYEAAEKISRQAILIDPALAEAHKNLANALCEMGRCEEALAPAGEAVRLKPDLDKAHYVLGKVMYKLGRYKESVSEYERAIQLNAEYDKAHHALGLAYDRLDDAGAAADAFRRARDIKPENAYYRERLELALRHLKRPGAPAQPPPSADFSGDNEAHVHYEIQVRDYLYHDAFDVLERVAGEARANRARVPGGRWLLQVFYTSLGDPGGGSLDSDAEWQHHLGRLKKWADARPESITARVALAEGYVGYAWRARGSGFSNTVNEEGWRLFRERLALAKSILNDAKGGSPKCPHWYAVMMQVALGESWHPKSHEELFAEATAFEPAYTNYYTSKAAYLLPRWHGNPGDWARFAEESADRVGGRDGSALYFRIVMSVAELSLNEVRRGDFLSGERVSWPRLRQGLADAEQAYGSSAHENNLACLIAAESGDAPAGRELLRRIGDNWDAGVWGSREEFDKYRGRVRGGE